jgi:hypothetical protein
VAIRLLEENALLNRKIAQRMQHKGQSDLARRFEAHAVEKEQHANNIRQVLLSSTSADHGQVTPAAESVGAN